MSQLKVISIDPNPINKDLVEKLEGLLANAKDGTIDGMVFACTQAKDLGIITGSSRGQNTNVFTLLGACMKAIDRYKQAAIE